MEKTRVDFTDTKGAEDNRGSEKEKFRHTLAW